MAIQLYIGFTVEGTTDTRFLSQVIQNVFEDLAFECRTDVIIEDVKIITVPKTTFVETICHAANKALTDYGMSILCVHVDADARTIDDVLLNKISPLYHELENLDHDKYCKNIVPIIPIQMTEAWMLADKELLKIKIGALGKRDIDLDLHREPESYNDPKRTIENAIRIAQAERTRRRRYDLTISDLYDELGQSVPLDKLRAIPSFREFEENVRTSLRTLGYIE